MTPNEIGAFLKKNRFVDFSFHGKELPGMPTSVIITIDGIQIRIPYQPNDTLDHLKDLIEEQYRFKLCVIDPKEFASFKGFKWKNDLVEQD
jgi:hypothetical protein